MGKKIDSSNLQTLVSKTFDKVIDTQHQIATANLSRLRKLHPEKTPQEMINHLNAWYLGVVAAAGAGAGAAAVIPNVALQVPVAIAEFAGYLEASVFYAYSVMAVHDLPLEDKERRKLLVASILIGNNASVKIIEQAIGRTAPYWGKLVVQAIPIKAVNAINKVLGPRFVVKWASTRGVLVLGKQIPMWIGAGIGATGNALFGTFVVKSAQKILGPAPKTWGKASGTIKKGVSKKAPSNNSKPVLDNTNSAKR